MSHHAWLDSLSEDWVSQVGSDSSQQQASTFPSPPVSTSSKNARDRPSHIPRFTAGSPSVKRPQHDSRNSSPSVLSERNPNHHNIRSAHLGSSKLSQDRKLSYRGRLSRSSSASTASSVAHHSVLRNKLASASPSNAGEDVPEWRRRLIHGELEYGESKDLFSSAAVGLENMFRPPETPRRHNGEEPEIEAHAINETTLPSSPPPYPGSQQDKSENDDSSGHVGFDSSVRHNISLPRPVFFRSTSNNRTESPDDDSFTMSDKKSDDGEAQLDGPAEDSAMSLRIKQLREGSRKTSGLSDGKHEDFSPIFLARLSSEGGGVSFTPMALQANQLHKKLELLQGKLISQTDNNPSSESASSKAGESENAEERTKSDDFLDLHRGRSAEESSIQQPPSPRVNIDMSELLGESSLQASTPKQVPKQFPIPRAGRFASASGIKTPASPASPFLPRAPRPSPEKRTQPVPFKTSSPLKLFGPHDTFTNQTLLRRISQFEDQQSSGPTCSQSESPPPPMPTVHDETERYDESTGSAATRRPQRSGSGNHEEFSAVNKFGAGELDDYEFEGDISMCSSIPMHSEEKENVTPSPSRTVSSNFLSFDIHEDVSFEGMPLSVRRSRHKTKRFVPFLHRTREAKSKDGLRSRSFPSTLHQSVLKRKSSEAKRPRTSPSKDPTPKRRRTLHRSDIAYGLEDRRAVLDSAHLPHYAMQPAILRDSKPVRRFDLKKFADSDNLPTYHSEQPRSPTPIRRSSELRDRLPLAELGFNVVPKSVTSLVSDENAGNLSAGGMRKVSMKTQDFYDAAEEIMAMIRNKARPGGVLASVEESEGRDAALLTHNESGSTDDSYQESTEEPFSRPPSRDGPPIQRMPVRQEDPKLLDQLRKYAETSDPIDMLGQSTRSFGKLKTNDQLPYRAGSTDRRDHLAGKAHVYDGGGVLSDIPDVRISRNSEHPEVGSNSTGSPPHHSHSSGSASERSIPTISSRGSDSKRLIGPDVVAQLIGNQVGNMVFDDVNKMWQKVKPSKPAMSILHSEDSEDDPFASIPDLTVDTTKEKQNLGLATSKDRPDFDERPQFRYSVKSFLSKTDHKVTEEPTSSERLGHKSNQAHVETAVEDDKEIEHEISLHEDRIHKSSPSRRKNLTITFSSPIASIIQDVGHSDAEDDNYEAEANLDRSFGLSNAADSIRRGRHLKIGLSSGMAAKPSTRSQSRGVSRTFSTDAHAFIPRPVSRIEEQDEMASHPQPVEQKDQSRPCTCAESGTVTSESNPSKNPDLRVMMATPDPPKTTAIFATPIIGQYVGTLSLSPMSEFTVHQVDNSCALEVSYIVGDKYFMSGDRSKKIMSKAVRSLVEKITEIEPFEPDWETLPELDLSNKKLDTLHMLDEFCTTLVTLDGSNNTFSHLDGVPQSVRNLRMTNNVLSEITAWRQLINLQYVDVSNNQIRSLSAFKDLIHLRSLRADNNYISSLDGIRFHDSLQVLRARGNQITHVDFDGTKMQRLTELDLENNQIVSFKNSEQLTRLSILNLQRNCLTYFAPSEGQISPSLKFLKLSSNNLQTLDLAFFPSLRLLHADRNNITTITGFSQCRRLDSLSLREQKGDNVLDTTFLDAAFEVRKLFLSGNRLSGFKPQVDFLNLQYLELANCGLQFLEPDIGQLMPNLRMLNINFNAIDDLWPLRYLPRLKKLHAAGNRLGDAVKIAHALAEFPHLSRLDLRNNGTTLGFYTPVQMFASADDSDTEKDDGFELPDVDVTRHEKRASRLDLDTRMRKRIYDMVVLNHCRQLKILDGLPVTHNVLSKKDDVWQALVERGILESDARHNASSR